MLQEGQARLDKARVMPVSTWHINVATCTVVHCHEGEVPSYSAGPHGNAQLHPQWLTPAQDPRSEPGAHGGKCSGTSLPK